jgi:calcineurin-like phosphoesterase family protein
MRNFFLAILLYSVFHLGSIISCSGNSGSKDEEAGRQFSFGVIADCQYSNKEDHQNRKYSLSKQKLIKAVNHFNEMDLEFVVQLGDLIDKDYTSYNAVLPILKYLNVPYYHVLGNHDFSISDTFKNTLNETLKLRSRYYDFVVKENRFIILDGNDISFHAYPKETEAYKDAVFYYRKNDIDSPKWNGAIGKKQLAWLRSLLDKANNTNEKVILMCHFPVYPEDEHNLWNAPEIINLIESYPCVKAYLSGHNHQGSYTLKGGIYYLNFKGMVETDRTSYSQIQVYADSLKVIGFGREENRTLIFNFD